MNCVYAPVLYGYETLSARIDNASDGAGGEPDNSARRFAVEGHPNSISPQSNGHLRSPLGVPKIKS
ncbi:MAG TPA: hypothetical protein VG759_17155 [Candidatus Angelobacter sp.]|nr:hypothetical protein [Candidatus Angelobacter sp.]